MAEALKMTALARQMLLEDPGFKVPGKDYS